MDGALIGSLIVGAAFVPWVVEMIVQLRLETRFLAALPGPLREALPPHPRRPWLGFLGSPRFQLALWRTFRRDRPGDPEPVLALKRRMRASLRREIVWSLGGIAVAAVVLFAAGWRPAWP